MDLQIRVTGAAILPEFDAFFRDTFPAGPRGRSGWRSSRAMRSAVSIFVMRADGSDVQPILTAEPGQALLPSSWAA